MRNFKIILGIILVFLLVGCGAKLNYNIDVDTNNQSIKLEATMTIEKSDYDYIEGGRDRFIAVINEYKPKEFEFLIDEKNQDEFKFIVNFNSYEDYLTKYSLLTGVESKSTFEVVEYSAESPFKASQNIMIEDNVSKMFDWLKEALVTSGSVSKENKEKMISSQNYHFTFDNKKQYSYSSSSSYKTESVVEIIQNEVEIKVKKKNKLDFKLSFIVDNAKYLHFTENFSNFIHNFENDIQYDNEEIIMDDVPYMKYNIQLIDIDASDESSYTMINSIFGDHFCKIVSSNTMKESTIKNQYFQNLDLQLRFSSLFNIGKLNHAQIIVDLDGVTVDKEKSGASSIEFPYTTDTSESYGNFHISLDTKYEMIKYPVIIAFILFIVIILVCIWKIGFNTIREKVTNISKMVYAKLYNLFQKYIFEKEFSIKNHLVIGATFIIQINNINKVHYGKKKTILNIIYKCLGILFVSIVLNQLGVKFISYIMMAVSMLLLILLIMVYRKNALHVELVSGREYSFIFETKEQAIKQYNSLLQLIEELDKGENKIDSIMKYVGENGGLKDEKA